MHAKEYSYAFLWCNFDIIECLGEILFTEFVDWAMAKVKFFCHGPYAFPLTNAIKMKFYYFKNHQNLKPFIIGGNLWITS